tara:strand:+ start:634 stop:837 length:204 start_codon:yes stop_codon:yes gene_type:complete
MIFWEVSLLDTSDDTEKSFVLKAENYERKRIIEILLDVHPEYAKLRVEAMNDSRISGQTEKPSPCDV